MYKTSGVVSDIGASMNKLSLSGFGWYGIVGLGVALYLRSFCIENSLTRKRQVENAAEA